MVADPKKKTAAQEPPKQPYVVKMSDGQRIWQIQIPVQEGSPSFSAAIPLDFADEVKKPPTIPQTEADREVIEAKRAAGEPIAETEPGEEPKTDSYLGVLARVRRALQAPPVRARARGPREPRSPVPGRRAHPREMKGTLYKKLGRIDEARRAWERVLALDPDNQMVGRALEQLLEETE